MDHDVCRHARAHNALADISLAVKLPELTLHMPDVVREFTPHVQIARGDRHGVARDQDPLENEMRVVLHELAVLKRARLRLVAIAAKKAWFPFFDGRHEAPLQTGIKTGTATAPEPARLDLIGHLGRFPVAVT